MASCEATRQRHWVCARAVSAWQTPWLSPSPLVKTPHKTQLIGSVYRTFLLAKLSNFVTRKGPSTRVIDVTSFVKTCQQEKKEESHQLHFQLSNVDSGQKFKNLSSSHEAQKKRGCRYAAIAVNLLKHDIYWDPVEVELRTMNPTVELVLKHRKANMRKSEFLMLEALKSAPHLNDSFSVPP